MIYYSTGKSSHLPKYGKIVHCENKTTIEILIKKGFLVENLETVEALVEQPEAEQTVETVEAPVEVKQPKVTVKATKPKGRPKETKK